MFAGFMVDTWLAATMVALAGGLIGFFVVLRGSAFPAHAIPNGAFAGAAAASLAGVSALAGLGVASVVSAFAIGALGRRGRHDVATALWLVFMLALGALLLARSGQYEPALYALLFGQLLGVSRGELIPVALMVAASAVAIGVVYRPLMLSSTAPAVGEAEGVRPYRMEMIFLVILALATAVAVPVVGSLLVFSLMIGPPAAARALTSSPPIAIALSVAIALVTVWLSVAGSYLSDWPVGFFVGTFGAVWYSFGRLWRRLGELFFC
ncbi:MAG: metal ABC transporter permease [Acidimicrobiales bacterium]